MNFFEKVYEVVQGIPAGHVMSYGQVALMAGNHRMARQVGWALHVCKPSDDVPWHRVVAKDGTISNRSEPGSENLQRMLLENEGVEFDLRGRIREEFFV